MRGSLIDRVIEPGAITPVFQPILDLRSDPPLLHALEGLSRGPRGTTLESPEILFEFARRKHEESLVDRAAIAAILGATRGLPEPLPIHLNVHASTIGRDPRFGEYLERLGASFGLEPERLVVEILEHSNFVDERQYLEGIERLRDAGIGIALDDVGVGMSNFRMILLTRPQQLKVDRCLIDGIAGDPYQQATLRAIRVLADQVGATIVAEGVEREADLVTLRALEVELGQGYLFSWPRLADELVAMLPNAPFALPVPRLPELATAC
jgi:EAL domain-containing protein (putative c-di-GMP-specific phosphodiesterase class I)